MYIQSHDGLIQITTTGIYQNPVLKKTHNFLKQTHKPQVPKMASLITTPLPKPKLVHLRPYAIHTTRANPNTVSNFWHHVPNKLSTNQNQSKPNLLTNLNWIQKRNVSVSASELSMGVNEPEAEVGRRILLSDVVVKNERKVFGGRKWKVMDVLAACTVLGMHLLSLLAPFQFNWPALWVAFGLYIVTGLLGITLSFHRNLSHRSFKLPKWLEYLFAYCGAQALQGHPIDWVSTHRYHHQFCDSDRDPHSPLEGFWFSHMNWFFDANSIVERCGEPNNVGDLEKQPFYRFLRTTYILHPVVLAAILYSFGGFPFLVWGMGVRIVWVYHITWLVNSACHVWGNQAWNTKDLSRNNWWVAVLAFGEGWHNNHHAFEYSARHGLEWWQVDMTWYVIKFLEAVGLASDVKLPSEIQKERMAF